MKTVQNTKKNIIQEQNILNIHQLGNQKTPRCHKIFGGSSYDRYLDIVLFLWSDIKAKFPDAELHIAYGWGLFEQRFYNNPERMEWKRNIDELMNQDGIFHYGRVGKEKLKEIRQSCGIWFYPTYFFEINCITALESQLDGLVPVVVNYGALDETVSSGVKVKGMITDKGVKEKILAELLDIMGNEERWKIESKKAKKFAKDYAWQNIARSWYDQLDTEIKQDIKVSIVTPTIRRGFWNIMADNLSKQTYKNFEWIIVDDHKQNREETAKKYAKKYNLDIKYYRGRERNIKRDFSLCNALNTAIENTSGELTVYLQDFMLIKENGIEDCVRLYKKFPNTLLAPVDIGVYSKIKPNTESEDWFNGETDVIGENKFVNIRIQNKGIRYSNNPCDWEINFAAIPTKILKEMGGFNEILDDGLGFDNTEFAYRAMLKGYKLLIDESILGIGLDHWEPLKDKPEELGKDRGIKLNDARYLFIVKALKNGILPLTLTREIMDSFQLEYKMPEGVDPVEYIRGNAELLVNEWLNKIK